VAVAKGPSNKPVLTMSFTSTNDLSAKQYYGVKLSADRTVILMAATGDLPIGVLMNKPKAAEDAEVMVMGLVKAIAGETLAVGDTVRFHSDGKAMIHVKGTDTDAHIAGQVTLGGAADEIIEMVLSLGLAEGT